MCLLSVFQLRSSCFYCFLNNRLVFRSCRFVEKLEKRISTHESFSLLTNILHYYGTFVTHNEEIWVCNNSYWLKSVVAQFLKFLLGTLFVLQAPIQDTTPRANVMCPWTLRGYDTFIVYLCVWWPRCFWEVLFRHFVGYLLLEFMFFLCQTIVLFARLVHW